MMPDGETPKFEVVDGGAGLPEAPEVLQPAEAQAAIDEAQDELDQIASEHGIAPGEDGVLRTAEGHRPAADGVMAYAEAEDRLQAARARLANLVSNDAPHDREAA